LPGFDGLADISLVFVDEAPQFPLRMPDPDGGEDVDEDLDNLEQVDLPSDLPQKGVLLHIDPRRASQDLGVGEMGHRGFATLSEGVEAAFDQGGLNVDHEDPRLEIEADGEFDGRLDDLRGASGELQDRAHGIHGLGLRADVHDAAMIARRQGSVEKLGRFAIRL